MSPRISERTHKTLVVSINAAGTLTAQLLALIIRRLAVTAHPIKYADATDLPVCLHKSADAHKTMNGLVDFGKSAKRLVLRAETNHDAGSSRSHPRPEVQSGWSQ